MSIAATEPSPAGSEHDVVQELERRLQWLDTVIAAAVERQRHEGRWRGEDDLRAVYTSPDLARAILDGRGAGTTGFAGDTDGDAFALADRALDALARIERCFGLDGFERFVLLLGLAPELDARYRTVFGYLNDDLTLGLPTVALALDLYAGAGPGSAALRQALRPEAALVRYRLVRLLAPAAGASLMRHGISVDEWLLARVIGARAPGPEAHRLTREPGPAFGARADTPTHGHPLVVSCDDRRAALEHGLELLACPGLQLALAGAINPTELVLGAAREARLDAEALVLDAAELAEAGPSLLTLASELADDGLAVLVTAPAQTADALPDNWRRRTLAAPSTAERRERWRAGLAAAGLAAAGDATAAVAVSHPITLDRIDAAVTRLASTEAGTECSRAELQAAARAVARHQLGGLARRVPGGSAWDDLVLAPATIRQLREIAGAIGERPLVLQQWGFGLRPGGRGMHLLFSGPSGTGKTLAASVIADAAGYALFAVDLARVVDKYLGETEKQLDRVFAEAAAAGAVLLFDEADALFGQRAEVRDARDRYANVEVAYLLQRLDAHEGVTILATNLPHHLDQAFGRRLHHRVEFAMPDAALRLKLWRAVLPAQAPLHSDLDLGKLAQRFELAGGAIRNSALTAAYLAAAEGQPISLRHAVRAIARELEKSGRPATRAEFRELHELLALTDDPAP